MFRSVVCTFLLLMGYTNSFGQMAATFTKTTNTKCNGSGCNYSGPSILINELMISPTDNDGSISGAGGVSDGRGEWIELYNPNLCEPVDISCYYLGNNAGQGGGYVIPAGTIVPAAGFAMVRGQNAAPVPANLLVANGGNVVELVVPYNISDPGVCVSSGGTRVWFPNAGGWFAFYDRNGVAQDAVAWKPTGTTVTNGGGVPCVPSLSGCVNVSALASYNNIPANRKQIVSNLDASNHMGNSLRRSPDGGAWSGNGAPTYAVCNGACASPSASSCAGTATINVTGGTAPYTYLWNDTQAQLTQTAIGLCAGTYSCTVRDNVGTVAAFSVTIENHVPIVSVSIVEEVCVNAPAVAVTVSPVAGAGQTGLITGNGITGTNFNPQTAGAGPHTVNYVYTDEFGCTNSTTDNITVNPLPIVSVNIIEQICIDGAIVPVTVSPVAAAGQTGTLTGPGITGTNFNPQTAGAGPHGVNYVFTNEKGCVNNATDNVTVNALPVLSVTGINPSYCISNTPVNFNLQPAGGTLSGPGVSNNAFVSAAAGVGTHTLTYSFTDPNGCSNSITANVQVVSVPSPSFIIPNQICNYAPAVPLAGTPAGGVFTIDGTAVTAFNPAMGDGPHSILYTYTDANNCIATSTETITVLPRPTLNTNLATFYCYQTGIVSLTNTPAGGTLTGDFTLGTGLDLATATPGNYSITYNYTDANGCENTLTKPFLVTSPITPDFAYSSDCFQKATFVNATTPVVGTTTYNWSFLSGALTSTATNPVVNYEQFGNHQVTLIATDSYNCPYTITKPIFITEGVSVKDFVIPNVITANGDGVNDVLELPALLEQCMQYKILILNRWGNLVYEMNSAQNAFSGLDKGGKELMPGVYFYIVESDDIDCKDEYKGFCSGMITIVR